VRVLVAEDERRVADAVARGLRREGMAVDVARDGADALFKARFHRPDVLVLDRDLPEVHGDEVCATVSAELPETRVLMLTGASELDDTVDGLALGADDYMGKPFAFAELVARVRALGRRSGAARPAILRAGDLELDPARRTVKRAGRQVELEVQQAYSNIVQSRELIRSQQQTVEQAQEALRLSSARLSAGAGTQLEVLNSRVEVTRAQSISLQALFTYNAAVAEFDRVTATEVVFANALDEPRTRDKVKTDTAPTPPPKPTPLPLNNDGIREPVGVRPRQYSAPDFSK